MKLNLNANGYQINDEAHYDVGGSKFILDHDLLMGGPNMEVWTGYGKTGIKLSENGDYYLEDEDTNLSPLVGTTVYTTIRIANAAYQTGPLFFTYKTIGDYIDSTSINNLTEIITGTPQTVFNSNMIGVWPWLSKYRRVDDTVLATGENNAAAICYTGKNIIVGCNTAPAKIVRMNNITNQEETSITLASGENNCQALLCDGQYVYAGLNTNPAKIIQINPITMQRSPALTLNTRENNCTALAYDGTYLYAVLGTSPCIVVKINPTNMTRIGAITLDTGENVGKSATVYGDSLYVGLGTSPGKVVRISLRTFTRTSVCALASGENTVNSLVGLNGWIFAGLETNKIAKINPVAMIESGAITITATNTKAMTSDGVYLYHTGSDGASGWLIGRYDPRSCSTISASIVTNNVVSLTFDGIAIFGGTSDSPATVVQKGIVTF